VRGTVLIIDSDQEFLRKIADDPAFKSFPAQLVRSGSQAEEALQNNDLCYAAILMHPLVGHPGGLRMIRIAHKQRPATPIYLLNSPALPNMSQEELHRIAVHGMMNKPITYSEIIKNYVDVNSYSKIENVTSGKAPSFFHPEYIATPCTEFLSGKKQFFDVYLALPDKRFLKLCEANDVFAPERVQNYIDQGVTHFYIKRASYENCLNYCDLLGRRVLRSKNTSPSLRISQLMSNGSELIEKIRSNGISGAYMDNAVDFTNDVFYFVRQQQADQTKVIEQYLKEISLIDHVLGTTIVASLLCAPLQFTSDTAMATVGIASMLHDIGLYKLPKHLHHEDPTNLSKEDKELFDWHPELGAQIVRSISGVHPTVVQAIAQHHKKRDSGGKNRLAEMIGIADAYVHELERPAVDLKFLEGFSDPVVGGLRKMFKVGG
jgi:putative nucleotidyltransferase with HDIG domain